MAQETDKQRDKRDRIERLRRRLEQTVQNLPGPARPLVAVIKGVLDLLDDEL